MPGFQRLAQFQFDAVVIHHAVEREAELEERGKPLETQRIARFVQFLDHRTEILSDEVRQHETVVQAGSPWNQTCAVRRFPQPRNQRTQQQHLQRTHLPVRRHFEGAKFQQAEPPGRAVRRIQLVDGKLGAVGVAGEVHEEISQQPVHQPGLRGFAAGGGEAVHFLERDFQFVQVVVARLVHARRLTGRPDEQAGEQVGQRRMILPVRHQAAHQVGAPQQRTVDRGVAANGDVVAAAGAGVPAVEHELLGAEAGVARVFVQRRGVVRELSPGSRRMDIDLDYAGIRSDEQAADARVDRGLVTLQHHRHAEPARGRLHRGKQIYPVLYRTQRRQENMHAAAAHLDAERRAHDGVRGGKTLLLCLGRVVRLVQGVAFLERVAIELRLLVRFGFRQRIERQTISRGRVTGDQVQVLALQRPAAAQPLRLFVCTRPLRRLQRQHVGRYLIQSGIQHLCQAQSILAARQIGCERIHVRRQVLFGVHRAPDVLVGRHHVAAIECQTVAEPSGEALPILRAVSEVDAVLAEPARILPQRLAVGAPETAECPARQRLPRKPFALAEMQHARGREALFQPQQQSAREAALVFAERFEVPLDAIHVVDGNEGRLAAHGEPHVPRLELRVHLFAQRVHRLPLFRRERFGDARILVDALELHVEAEIHLRNFGEAGNRRGRSRALGAGERNMTFPGQQSGSRIESHPAGTRHEGLGPGVQVGEVLLRPSRSIQRFLIRRDLHQVAGHEPRRDAEIAQQLHQQPAGIAAGTEREFERLIRRLYAGLHAHDVADVALQAGVDRDQQIGDWHAVAQRFLSEAREPRRAQRTRRLHRKVGHELVPQLIGIGEREVLRVALDEEVERVDHRQVRYEIDGNLEFGRLVWKDRARDPVAVRILLPVEEVLSGRNL